MNNYEIEKQLKYLVEEQYLWGYKIDNDYITIRYGLASCKDTERTIEIDRTIPLSFMLLKSAKDLEDDIRFSLTDENDFYGYSNKEELEDRIKEETDYLDLLSKIVSCEFESEDEEDVI